MAPNPTELLILRSSSIIYFCRNDNSRRFTNNVSTSRLSLRNMFFFLKCRLNSTNNMLLTNAENLSTRPDYENVIAKCDLPIKMILQENGQGLISKALHILFLLERSWQLAALENSYIFHTGIKHLVPDEVDQI